MDKLTKADYDMSLYRGKNVIFDNIIIKQFTLNQIEEMKMSNYYKMINIITYNKYELANMVKIPELKTLPLFDIYFKIDAYRQLLIAFLGVFVECTNIKIDDINKAIIIVNNDSFGILNENNFDDFIELIRYVHCVTENEIKEYDKEGISERLRKMLINQEIEKAKLDEIKGNYITLNSMIQSVSCKHPSLNHFNIWDSTVFQLKKDLIRLYAIDGDVNIRTAIYTGNGSGFFKDKTFKMENYDWSKELTQ